MFKLYQAHGPLGFRTKTLDNLKIIGYFKENNLEEVMKREQIVLEVADILQSVYSKQSRETHEILADCILNLVDDKGVTTYVSPDSFIFKYLGRRPIPSMDYLRDICKKELRSQS